MPSTIVLNQSNIVPDGNNSSLVYRFPNSVSFPHHEMAVQSVALYYAWENINALPLGNNIFRMGWRGPGDAEIGPLTFTIPDGLYEVVDLNRFLQFQCIKNGWYLINNAGRNVYYAEFILNPNRYAVQINTFPVPYDVADWALQPNGSYLGVVAPYVGWSTPLVDPASPSSTGSFPGFAGVSFNPNIILPNNFNKILGFTVPNPFTTGYNQGATSGQNQSFLSNVAPQVQPNSSAYLSISNINNKYAIPSSIIYSISPNVIFGSQIIEEPPQFAWNPLLNGTYNEIRLQILGINFQPLKILDPNMTIVLVIRDTKDLGVQELITKASGGKS